MITAIHNHPFWTLTILTFAGVLGFLFIQAWDTEWVKEMLSKLRPSKRFFTYRSGHGRHAIGNISKFATA